MVEYASDPVVGPERPRAQRGRRMPGFLPFLAALVCASIAFLVAERIALADLRTRLDQSILLTSRAVISEIDRFRSLPDVAAEDARIRAALADASAIPAANSYLERVSSHAGASELFLINAAGITIASSNWARPGSFVGQTYAFRPYFRQAMDEGRGQFYAIGVTTGVPGYFLSRKVGEGSIEGVLVVKLDLRPLQQTWRAAGVQTAISDGDGVIFLSGRDDWLYRPLSPLSQDALVRIGTERTYDGVSLSAAMPILPEFPVSADTEGDGWIARSSALPGTGWSLIAAEPSGPVRVIAWATAAATALLALFVAGVIKATEQRRQILALRLSQSERLEEMVKARTADLGREVEARTLAEAELRAAQEHLIHAEKMAALGRMSTAIVHEISQPLAAMEATLAATGTSLGTANKPALERLERARGLIRRMQRTTKHLKSFGRKESGQLSLIDLMPVVHSAMELVLPRARAVGVVPSFEHPADPVTVLAGAVRMEQVVVNLLLNALDAVEGISDARIVIRLDMADGHALLEVSDTGTGIASDILPRIAEPFFSTKEGGEGLGLGLSISRAILSEFGGAMQIQSQEGEGTKIMVTLPLADAARHSSGIRETAA